MKIALVAQHAVPLPRAERATPDAEDDIRIRDLSRGLATDGHDVTVYAQRPAGDPLGHGELCPGVTVEYLGPAADRDDYDLLKRVPGFTAPLRDRLGENPPDVVHALRWTSGLAALAAARDQRLPVVQSFASLCLPQRRHRLVQSGTGLKRLRLVPAIGRSASAVVADCEDEESELARAGVPRRSIRVVPCGVDTQRFMPEGPAAACDTRPRLLTVTSLESYDELATLLRTLAQVPDVELVVAGGPPASLLGQDPAYRKLSELADTLGVADRVQFAGQVARDDLPPLLRSADLMVSLAQYDPAGMVVLEAMACGTPVVAADGGGYGDAVIDAVTGILVPAHRPALIAQRIRQLLRHPMRLAAFGVAAADRARSRYAWDRIARETVAVYDHATALTA
ncbi:MAG: glycosyltransferase [Nocardiopsaceae bacterium]|nr:glycosyltransferase [Nocardiopsaceae bacterium]